MTIFTIVELGCSSCGDTLRLAVDPARDQLAICSCCWSPLLIGRDDLGDIAVLDRNASAAIDFRARRAARRWARARSLYLNETGAMHERRHQNQKGRKT